MSDSYLVFEVAGESFAVPAKAVVRLLQYDPKSLRRPFGGESSILGFLPQAGAIIPALDLRLTLGFTSVEQETKTVVETLSARERDHVAWLDELQASVKEGREFRLTTNPHECAFGKWYDALKADAAALHSFVNGNSALQSIFVAFDEPHRKIHNVAVEVRKLVVNKRVTEAMDVIEHAKYGVLRTMVDLFSRARNLISSQRRTLLLVLEHERDHMGLLIDRVLALRMIGPEHLQNLSVKTGLVSQMAIMNNTEKPAALIDVAALFGQAKTQRLATPELAAAA
ncbi:MAG: chemotaxis protein CheW [Phycisphaerales bacterium]|nr:chemotaxis protein CheW [Phycisphaerales bacterium]